jgi:hypothetical protein
MNTLAFEKTTFGFGKSAFAGPLIHETVEARRAKLIPTDPKSLLPMDRV